MEQSTAILSFAVLGGDMRQNYIANYLCRKGHSVICCQTPALPELLPAVRQTADLSEALSEGTVIIGPVPFSRDQKNLTGTVSGGITLTALHTLLEPRHTLIGGNLTDTAAFCTEHQINHYDFMTSESLTAINAAITAESMLGEIIAKTPYTLQKKSVLLIGYGNCGAALAQTLKTMGCDIFICELLVVKRILADAAGFTAFAPSDLSDFLSRFSLIVNTVPAPVLPRETISLLAPDVILFDLSSPPGGIDFKAAKEHNIPAYHCLGLPGKLAPQTAGEAIGKNILEKIFKQLQ